ncbi:MAG: RNA methyltransferase [Oscillatoriales cyanobacterium RM2_1_1]|nr:RNA methyltransferase [Oscillatoriales cyanobacterium RM2_1_1]
MTSYFATVARGLEPVAVAELERLNADNIQPDFAGVHFTGDRTLLYQVNLWARTLFRVLVPIHQFVCTDADQLYRGVQEIDWEIHLTPTMTFAVNCTGSNDVLNHSHFTALQVKNAIVDQQRQRFGERSDIDPKLPDLLINLHIRQDQGILSLDSSGTSLHRRGYRPAVGQAPLKETLAAALLDLAEWSPDLPLLDPMCGSGTLPLEASLKALKIAPGSFREHFGFMTWRDFDPELWQHLCHQAEIGEKSELPALIQGCDRNPKMVTQAQFNAVQCGVADQLRFWEQDLNTLEAPADRGIVICNPPYGERLGEAQKLGSLYKLLGDTFKQRFKGWTAFILTGNRDLAKQIGLRTARRTAVYNGALPCTLLKYELY